MLNSTRSTQASLFIFLITIWNFTLSICVSLYQMASSRKFQKRENICSVYKYKTKKNPKFTQSIMEIKQKIRAPFFSLLSLPLMYIKGQPWHGGAESDLRVEEQDSEGKIEEEGERKGKETGRHALGNGKAFKWDSNQGNMSGCFQLGSLTFSQLSAGAKAAFSLIV